MRALSVEEWKTLPEPEQVKWDLVEQAHEGCLTCPLLAVCRKRLAEKPQTATGGFYKPIVSVIQKFRDNDPDTAEAELMCWRPGSEGLIYPRFVSQVGKGNVIDYKTAYETLMGPTTNVITELTLIQAMHDAGIQFFAGVDWGYTHDFTIIIMAMIPNGEVWVVDSFAAPGLEMADMLRVAIPYRDKYRVQAWFCDPAYPANVKTFTRNQMRSPKFTKDVMAGIESVRSKITDGIGKRLFKIINRPENKKLVTAMTKHRFKLDGQGNITTEPDDERGIADLCDALRYIGQNKFPIKGSQRPGASWAEQEQLNQLQNPTVTEQMKQEIASRIADAGGNLTNVTSRKGGFHWNF